MELFVKCFSPLCSTTLFPWNFNETGLNFQWTDGLFSVALSGTKPNGYRTAFFHALASNGEFSVSTEVLRNEQHSTRRTHGQDFKFLGQRGFRSQAGTHCFDLSTNVIFFADMQKASVSCWNVRDPLNPSSIHLVQRDNSSMIYPTDLDVSLNFNRLLTSSLELFISILDWQKWLNVVCSFQPLASFHLRQIRYQQLQL